MLLITLNVFVHDRIIYYLICTKKFTELYQLCYMKTQNTTFGTSKFCIGSVYNSTFSLSFVGSLSSFRVSSIGGSTVDVLTTFCNALELIDLSVYYVGPFTKSSRVGLRNNKIDYHGLTYPIEFIRDYNNILYLRKHSSVSPTIHILSRSPIAN